jgi:hypothetical protein
MPIKSLPYYFLLFLAILLTRSTLALPNPTKKLAILNTNKTPLAFFKTTRTHIHDDNSDAQSHPATNTATKPGLTPFPTKDAFLNLVFFVPTPLVIFFFLSNTTPIPGQAIMMDMLTKQHNTKTNQQLQIQQLIRIRGGSFSQTIAAQDQCFPIYPISLPLYSFVVFRLFSLNYDSYPWHSDSVSLSSHSLSKRLGNAYPNKRHQPKSIGQRFSTFGKFSSSSMQGLCFLAAVVTTRMVLGLVTAFYIGFACSLRAQSFQVAILLQTVAVHLRTLIVTACACLFLIFCLDSRPQAVGMDAALKNIRGGGDLGFVLVTSLPTQGQTKPSFQINPEKEEAPIPVFLRHPSPNLISPRTAALPFILLPLILVLVLPCRCQYVLFVAVGVLAVYYHFFFLWMEDPKSLKVTRTTAFWIGFLTASVILSFLTI